MKKSLKDLIILVSIGLLSVLLSFILVEGPLSRVKDTIFNAFFHFREVSTDVISEGVQKREFEGISFFTEDIVIVGIDDKSLSVLGKFPFPRSYYGDYVLKPLYSITNNKKPNIVFFDIVFSEYSTEKEDKAFISILEKAKDRIRVAFDYMFVFEELGEEGLPLDSQVNREKLKPLKKFTIPRSNVKGKSGSFVNSPSRGNLPIREISERSYGVGYANISKYNVFAETYNVFPMVLEYNGDYYPSILLILLCSYYEVSLSNVIVYLGEKIVIKDAKVKYPDGSFETRDVFIPIDEYNNFFVNYVSRSTKLSRSGFIRTISLSDLPRIRGIGNFVDGKVLMIGMLAYGYGDVWKSPIADNMYGIEHIANAMNNVIMANIQGYPGFVRVVPRSVVVLISLVMAFIAVLILVLTKRIILVLAEAIGVMFLFVFISYFIFSQGTIIPFLKPISTNAYLLDVLTPGLAFITSYIGGQVFIISRERAQRLQIKSMLDSYVSPEVVNLLLKNPEKLTLGGEDREVTIFFSDIRGFTSLSEGLSPQELVSLINRYLSRMTDIIMDNRGTVDKYIGDAIMAFWGAPLDDPEHAYRACKASLEMLQALEEINSTLPPDKQIEIGIGINTGIATIGNMGSTKKKNYTAMGDSVNLASRLEGVNKLFHTRIIISEYTYEKVKDRVIARELDLIRVKGKKMPVRIYELIGFVEDYNDTLIANGMSLNDIQPEV